MDGDAGVDCRPTMAGLVEADVVRAIGAGLTFRPFGETARGALEKPRRPTPRA